MAPKSGTETEGGSTNLSAKEIKLLGAVISSMGGLPDIDWDALTTAIGMKHTKNAKSACKKLFDKLRAEAPVIAASSGSKTTTPKTKKTRSGPAPVVPSDDEDEGLEVPGKDEKVTPKKAPTQKAASVKKKAPSKKAAKAVPADDEEEGDEEQEDVDMEDSDEEGKFRKSTTKSIRFAAPIMDLCPAPERRTWNLPLGGTAPIPAVGAPAIPDELFDEVIKEDSYAENQFPGLDLAQVPATAPEENSASDFDSPAAFEGGFTPAPAEETPLSVIEQEEDQLSALKPPTLAPVYTEEYRNASGTLFHRLQAIMATAGKDDTTKVTIHFPVPEMPLPSPYLANEDQNWMVIDGADVPYSQFDIEKAALDNISLETWMGFKLANRIAFNSNIK